jgi:heme/copper-type cytochrome/quinol oxidase subunit 2
MKSLKVLVSIGALLACGLWTAAAQETEEMYTPGVTVNDQAVQDARVTIAEVVSEGPGWLVIHLNAGGKPGAVIGYAAVKDGENPNVVVAVDPKRATGGLFAMLHTDAGVVGTYEFPGPDVPVMAAGGMVNVPFKVTQSMVQRIDLKASRFSFSPSTLEVKAGVPVELHIVSTDGTHGIAIPGLSIKQQLDQGKETVVSFTPDKAGQYPFRCSVMCGQGHLDMKGQLIVE